MKVKKAGFSLLELSIVMLISGMTFSALFQMLDLSFVHYQHVDDTAKEQLIMSKARIWLRNQITEKSLTTTGLPEINESALFEALNLSKDYFIHELRLSAHHHNSFFVKLSLCHDKNQNKIAENTECFSSLFFFRNRT